ncbi:CRISPR system precrRNA processing endoribonuclease RAMP protein Cas6 [Chloroflexales bacterium ZM16-3]|nr:CRISPR system precrRNA processing endoribonuclease RAMP protein Cas6 [Chloroflexales bacterium ZM16-3]
MFIAIVINAIPRTPRHFTVNDASFAHAALLSAIARVDEAVDQVLHDASRHKAFSCAILPGVQPVARIRIVLHDVQHEARLPFCQTLLTALSQCQTLRLGSVICELQNVEITPSEWSGVASWTDLLDDPVSSRIGMRFLSPTAIMKTDGSGQRYSSLFPDPGDIFLGLQRRWIALGGPALSPNLAEILNDAGCIIARHALQTTAFQAPERLQIGFCGSVTYQLRNTQTEFIQTMCALARFAHYTGVGYQTTRGMGLVQTHIER